MQFPVLHTKRLSLIEIEQHHLNDLYGIFSDPEVTRFYNLLPFKEPKDGQNFIDWYQNRFADGLAIRWGIALKGEKNIIGTIGFNNYTKHHRANIGYDLHKTHWNKGYITEALKAIIAYGFKELEINRIEAEAMTGNEASEKVLHKLNFTREGVLREWMFWNSKYYDIIMYSLLSNRR